MKEISRNKQREIIMIALYQIFLMQKNKISYELDDIIQSLVEGDNEFISNTIYGIIKNIEKIDEMANKYLANWDISRLGQTDQAILRMGIFEMMYTDTPKIVVIDEAVELAKHYSDEKVKGMINSVLDKIYKNEK